MRDTWAAPHRHGLRRSPGAVLAASSFAATVITTNTNIMRVDPAIADRLEDERTGLVKKFALDLPSYRSGKVWKREQQVRR